MATFDIALKGWIRIKAAKEEEAREQAQDAIERLIDEAHKHGHIEGTFFEEVGIEPVSDPPAVNAE